MQELSRLSLISARTELKPMVLMGHVKTAPKRMRSEENRLINHLLALM
jgi:hypothetical protein